MIWQLTTRADPRGAALADRHYSRQKIGAAQFMPPGGCVVLYAETPAGGRALWGTSTPKAEYVLHQWAGAWMCSIFRNEGAGRATDLIWQALAATRAVAGDPPELGLMTFIDRRKVLPIKVRGRDTWGRTYQLAGFRHVGETKSGLMAWQLLPADWPAPAMPIGAQAWL